MALTQEQINSRPGLFKKGVSGNPGGRKKGSKSLKTFVREYLEGLSDEDKLLFMEDLPKEIIWKMAEGNPKQDTDVTSGGKELKQVLVTFIDGDSTNNKNTAGVQTPIQE